MSDPTLIAAGGKRSRRSWSDEEKRRIVAEAVLPGASVADIARRHGVNANLVFNWRKTARAVLSVAEPNASPVALPVIHRRVPLSTVSSFQLALLARQRMQIRR